MKSNGLLIIFVLTLLALTASAYALSPHEELQQLVVQLQKTPDNAGLREQIVKLATSIKPAPGVTPEAKRPFVMANTYQKEAKTPSDFALAIDAYQEALQIAPWWGDAYYNMSLSLESAGRLDEAKTALNLYLLANPNDEEAQNRLYALDAKKTLAAKRSAEVAVESFFCAWYADQVAGTSITLDPGRSSLTYFEREAEGKNKPAIVSRVDISGTDIGWTQAETFPNQSRPTSVRYNLNRISGELDYWYTSATGEPRSNRLHCVKGK